MGDKDEYEIEKIYETDIIMSFKTKHKFNTGMFIDLTKNDCKSRYASSFLEAAWFVYSHY